MAFQLPGSGISESASNPAWYQAGLAGVLQDAQSLYDTNKNFTPYSGQVVAPTNAMQTGAAQNVQNMVGGLSNYSQNLQQYMNPYQSGVVDQIATLGNRNLTENVLPQLQSGFTGAGQFGSKRMMDFQNRAVRDSNDSIMNQQNQALQSGFQQANQNMNAQNQMMLAGNQALNQYGNEEWNRGQQQNQFNLNQWNTEQQYPFQSYGWLSNIVRGLQPGQVGGVNFQYGGASVPSSPNYLQTLGGLSAVAGALGQR